MRFVDVPCAASTCWTTRMKDVHTLCFEAPVSDLRIDPDLLRSIELSTVGKYQRSIIGFDWFLEVGSKGR